MIIAVAMLGNIGLSLRVHDFEFGSTGGVLCVSSLLLRRSFVIYSCLVYLIVVCCHSNAKACARARNRVLRTSRPLVCPFLISMGAIHQVFSSDVRCESYAKSEGQSSFSLCANASCGLFVPALWFAGVIWRLPTILLSLFTGL